MDVLYYQRSRLPEDIEAECSATYVTYEELLERSDFISVHLPLNVSTEGMVDGAGTRCLHGHTGEREV